MKLSDLKAPESLSKPRKRLGRGVASGTGKTAGRGNKGYHSRSGSKRRTWLEVRYSRVIGCKGSIRKAEIGRAHV